MAYLVLAEAATVAPPDKVNALGMGVRRFLAPSFPILLDAVVLAQAEASHDEKGKPRVRITLTDPSGKVRVLAEGRFDLETRAEVDRRRPITLSVRTPLTGLSIDEPGPYQLHAAFGRARAEYTFVVDLLGSDSRDAGEPDDQ